METQGSDYPPFSDDCDRDGFIGSILNERARDQLKVLEEVYTKNHPSKPYSANSIPHIIHQVWLGTRPIPEDFKRYMESIKRLHPGWEYRLWTDREIEEVKPRFRTGSLVDEMTGFGQKVDVIRAELVHLFGGVYADCDYECLKPLDEIHDRYDFYGTLRLALLLFIHNSNDFPSPIIACNSLIGARPSHPILALYLDKVAELQRRGVHVRLRLHERYGPARLLLSPEQAILMGETFKKTYITFHEAICEYLAREPASGDSDRAVMLPPTVFNPLDTHKVFRWVSFPYMVRRLKFIANSRKLSIKGYDKTLPHTRGIHHSRASWLYP